MSQPMTDDDRRVRVLRQDLQTSELFGVPFVPVAGLMADSPVDGTTDPNRDRNKAAELDALREEHANECPHCTAMSGINNLVFGEGNPDARLMFIGEAPGAEEDRTGRPFVGRAGKKLDEMIEAMGMHRRDVYIANVLKSRPPDNRTPLRPEVGACSPYLARQIRIIHPTVIVTVGGPATKLLLHTEIGISRLRGQWASYQDGPLTVDVMPTFHPAYLLRAYTPDNRRKVWSDLQAVMKRIDGT